MTIYNICRSILFCLTHWIRNMLGTGSCRSLLCLKIVIGIDLIFATSSTLPLLWSLASLSSIVLVFLLLLSILRSSCLISLWMPWNTCYHNLSRQFLTLWTHPTPPRADPQTPPSSSPYHTQPSKSSSSDQKDTELGQQVQRSVAQWPQYDAT